MTSAPKAKIYTRTGDKGSTRLVDGSIVDKFNPRVEAYGTVDELNSYLGVTRSSLQDLSPCQSLDSGLEHVQNALFNIGSLLATEKEEVFKMLPLISEAQVRELETQIDQMTLELPELRQFILPGGHMAASHLHVARTLCRRSERRALEVTLKGAPGMATQEERYALCIQYLNRLSDYLFVAARWVNFKTGHADVPWKKSE